MIYLEKLKQYIQIRFSKNKVNPSIYKHLLIPLAILANSGSSGMITNNKIMFFKNKLHTFSNQKKIKREIHLIIVI